MQSESRDQAYRRDMLQAADEARELCRGFKSTPGWTGLAPTAWGAEQSMHSAARFAGRFARAEAMPPRPPAQRQPQQAPGPDSGTNRQIRRVPGSPRNRAEREWRR